MTFASGHLVDGAVLLALAISILVGIFRGATREILGIAGWAGAFATVFYGLPLCRPLGRQYIHNAMVADGVTAGCLFVLSLAVFIIISRMLSSRIKGGVLGGLDRSLGLVFGIVRGGLMVCLSYLTLSFFYPPHSLPLAVKTARLTPWIALGTEKLILFIPKDYLPDNCTPHKHAFFTLSTDFENHPSTVEETIKHLSTLKPISSQKLKSLEDLITIDDDSSSFQ